MSDRIDSLSDYFKRYEESIADPEQFWEKIAKQFHWQKPWDTVLDWDFEGQYYLV